MRRLLLRCLPAVVATAAAVAVLRSFGMDLPHLIAAGCAVLAVGLLLALRPAAPAPFEPDPAVAGRPGGRRDVDELAWAMLERRTRVRTIVIDRVRATARPRLAGRGLDLARPEDGPAIERLLGATAWSVLRPDRAAPVLPAALDATLSALERLDAVDPTGAQRASTQNRTPDAG